MNPMSLSEPYLIAILCVGNGALIAITGIIFGTVSSVKRAKIEANLKRDMLDQGLSPEAIVQVIEAGRDKDHKHVSGAADLPCACEAVVEHGGEWRPALVLRRAEGQGQYYVHFVGTDMDENEWVGEERIRVAPDSSLSSVGLNGLPKKEPLNLEL
jgi:RNA binding activity-knot of a chromodomain